MPGADRRARVRDSRLALSALTLRVLETGLGPARRPGARAHVARAGRENLPALLRPFQDPRPDLPPARGSLDGMDNNRDSADEPADPAVLARGRPAGLRPDRRRRHRCRRPPAAARAPDPLGRRAAAAAALIGGGTVLAANSGPASPAPATDLAAAGPAGGSQAAALSTVLGSADAPTPPRRPPRRRTRPRPRRPAAPGPPVRRRRRGPARSRRTRGPRDAPARSAGAGCGRLRLLIAGEHGQVTYRAKDGTSKTLAFERGKITVGERDHGDRAGRRRHDLDLAPGQRQRRPAGRREGQRQPASPPASRCSRADLW